MKKKIEVFLSADKNHIIVAEWKGRGGGYIYRYTKKEGDECMPKESYARELEKLELDNFYIMLERE